MTQIARQPGLVYERTDEGDVAPPVSKYARARALAAQAPAAPSKYAAARQLAAQSMPSSPGMASIVTQPGGMPSTTASQLTRPGSLENLGSTIGDFAQAGADFVQSAPYGAMKDAYDQAAGFGARLANNPTIGRAMEAIGLRPDLANDTSGYEPDVQPPDSVAGQLGRGFGSVGSMFAASALTGGAPVVLPLVAGAQSLGATYQAARDRALQMGADEAQAHQIAAAEADTMGLVSTVTSLPVGKALSGIAPQALSRAVATANRGGQLGQLVKTAVAEGSQEAAEEAAQMILQRVAEDDPAAFQDWQKRIAISAGAGAIGGGVIAGVQAVGGQQGQRQAPQDYPAQREALGAFSPQNAQQFAQPVPRGEQYGPEASVQAVEQGWPSELSQQQRQEQQGLSGSVAAQQQSNTAQQSPGPFPGTESRPSESQSVAPEETRATSGEPSNLSSLTLAELRSLDLQRGGTGKGTRAALSRRLSAQERQEGIGRSSETAPKAAQSSVPDAGLSGTSGTTESPLSSGPESQSMRPPPVSSPSQPPAGSIDIGGGIKAKAGAVSDFRSRELRSASKESVGGWHYFATENAAALIHPTEPRYIEVASRYPFRERAYLTKYAQENPVQPKQIDAGELVVRPVFEQQPPAATVADQTTGTVEDVQPLTQYNLVAKAARGNRGDANFAIQKAFNQTVKTGREAYVHATANGFAVSERPPFKQDHYRVTPDGKVFAHRFRPPNETRGAVMESQASDGRRRVIEARLARGENVPASMLEEFPDLKPKAPTPEATAAMHPDDAADLRRRMALYVKKLRSSPVGKNSVANNASVYNDLGIVIRELNAAGQLSQQDRAALASVYDAGGLEKALAPTPPQPSREETAAKPQVSREEAAANPPAPAKVSINDVYKDKSDGTLYFVDTIKDDGSFFLTSKSGGGVVIKKSDLPSFESEYERAYPKPKDNPAYQFAFRTPPWNVTKEEMAANEDQGVAPNNPTPDNRPLPPIGTYAVDKYGGWVMRLEMVDPNELILTEDAKDGRRHPLFGKYVQWAKEGKRSPIYVSRSQSESQKGKLVSSNRRRVLAAIDAGLNEIPAWVDVAGPDGTALKHEQWIELAVEEGYQIPDAVLAEYPRLAKKYAEDDADAATPPASTETGRAPTEDELVRVELLRKWGDKWQYKFSPESGWKYANSKEGAIETATEAYKKANPGELMTREEKNAKADEDEYQKLHGQYKHMTLAEVKQMRDRAAGYKGVSIDREFDGNGGRRTAAAVANQGSRDSAETVMQLDRYLAERTKRESTPPASKPLPSVYQQEVDETKPTIDRHIGNEVSLRRKLMAFTSLATKKPPTVQEALAAHLRDKHPDVFAFASTKEGVGLVPLDLAGPLGNARKATPPAPVEGGGGKAETFRRQLSDVLKSQEEGDAVFALVEARAKAAGESVEQYLGKRVAGIERGGKPGPDALRQDPAKNLVVMHNLSAQNVLFSKNLEGLLAMPSVAIADVGSPITGFGEISLVAPKELIDPKASKTNRVYDTDVYSARYPQAVFSLKSIPPAWSDIEAWAKETYGDLRSESLKKEDYEVRSLQYGIRSHFDAHEIDRRGPEGVASDAGIMAYFASKKLGKTFKGTDKYETKQKLRSLIEKNKDAFESWIRAEFEPYFTRRIFAGFTNSGNRRYKDYTIDNVMKEMRKSQKEDGGEGFFYGAGSVRAQVAKKYKSIAQIQKDRGRVVPQGSMESTKDQYNDRLIEIASDGMAAFGDAAKSSLGFTDRFWGFVIDAKKKGRAFVEKSYDVDYDAVPWEKVNNLLAELQALPTEYFEAKIDRAVGIGEFSGAVIPDDTKPEVIDALRSFGVAEIATYKRSNESDRARAIAELANKQGLLFQGAKGAIEFARDGRAIIHAFESADVSTMVHEIGHLFRRDLAGPELAAAEKWAGAKDGQWSRGAEERFARGFERYLRDGKSPIPALSSVFAKFEQWLSAIYKTITGSDIDVKIPAEMRRVYDSLFTEKAAPSQPTTPAPKDMAALKAKYPGVTFKPVRGVYIPSTLKGKALAEWRNTASGVPFKDQIALLDARLGKAAKPEVAETADSANEWSSKSPAGRQWARFKDKYPDSLLAMRIGDFYEFFGTDAEKVSKSVGLTLTSRAGVPMAGIPYHQLESTLKKLIAAGHRVAVAEPVNGNKAGIDGTVARSVERIETPEKMVEETPDAEPAKPEPAPETQTRSPTPEPEAKPAAAAEAARTPVTTPARYDEDNRPIPAKINLASPAELANPTDPTNAARIVAHYQRYVKDKQAWLEAGPKQERKIRGGEWAGMRSVPDLTTEAWQAIDKAYKSLVAPVQHDGPSSISVFALPGKESLAKEYVKKMAAIKPGQSWKTPLERELEAEVRGPAPLRAAAGDPNAGPPKVAKTPVEKIRTILPSRASEHTSFSINGVFQAAKELVSTDGRRLWKLRGKYAEPGLYLQSDNPDINKGELKKTGEGTFPPYDDVIPRGDVLRDPIFVDAERSARNARIAAMMTAEDRRGVLVVKNKDGSLGFAAAQDDVGTVEVNVRDGYEELGWANPQYVAEAFDFVYANGDKQAKVQWGKKANKPFVITGPEGGTTTVTMPINAPDDLADVKAIRGFGNTALEMNVENVGDTVDWLNDRVGRGSGTGQVIVLIGQNKELSDKYLKHPRLKETAKQLIRAQIKMGGGGSSGTPGTASRSNMESLAERMNQIADEARTRRKNRRLPSSMPGFRSGGSPLIPDAIDFGIEIAARAVAKGITGGQALTKHISAALKTLPEELKPYGGRVRYVARRVVLGATKNGVFQPSLMADSIQTERLRHAENDETVKARQKLHKIVGGTDKAKAEPKLRQEIDENLGVRKAPTYTVGGPVDLEQLLPEHRYAIATLYTSVKRGKAISGTNEAAEFINAQNEKGLANLFTPEMLAELRGLEGRGAKGGMTPDQMELIATAIRHVAHLSKTQRSATVLGQIRQLDEDGATVVGELTGRVNVPKQGLIDRAMGRAEKEPNPGIARRFLVRAQDSLGDMLHVAFGDAVMKKYGYEAIAKAEGAKRLEYIKADAKLREVLTRHKIKAEDVGKAVKNSTTFNLPNAGEVKIPAMEALDIVLMAGDQQNTAKLVKNGVLPKRFKGQVEKKIDITEADIEALGQQLPKWLMDFGRTGVEIINGYTDQVNETSVKIDGVEIAEKRTGSDYYYPRSPDDVLRTAGVRQDEAMELAWAERLGFTKKRTGSSVPYQIRPAIERIMDHIDGATTYIHMAEPTLNVRKLIARPEVLENIQKRLGSGWRDTLLRHLSESQGMVPPAKSNIQGAGRWLLRNTARTALWGRLSSAMAQAAGVPMLMNRMTGKERAHFLKHLAKLDWVKNPTVMREMTDGSGYFADRYPEVGEQTRLGTGIDLESSVVTTPMGRWYQEALRVGFKPMEYGDKVLSALAYMAAKDAGHPDPVFRAEMLIRQSQNATSPMDRSGMMLEGEKNALVGALALFSSAPNRVRGQIRADLSDVRANPKSGKAWARLAATALAAGIAAAIGESIRELWRRQKVGFSPEDKPRTAVDHLVNALATLGDSIVPKGGQLLRATINGLRGKVSQTFDSPGMDLADSLGTMLGHLDADEEKAKRLGPNIDRALRALSSFTGVVGEPVYDLGVGIYRTFNPPATIAAYSEAIRAGNYEEARRIAAELRKANPKIDLKARRKNYEERVGVREKK